MKSVLLAILGILLGYLMGAFYSVSFDISLWCEGARFLSLVMMLSLGAGGAIFGKLKL